MPQRNAPGKGLMQERLKSEQAPAMARNISFSNISSTVTTRPSQLPDAQVTGNSTPGEAHNCAFAQLASRNLKEVIGP